MAHKIPGQLSYLDSCCSWTVVAPGQFSTRTVVAWTVVALDSCRLDSCFSTGCLTPRLWSVHAPYLLPLLVTFSWCFFPVLLPPSGHGCISFCGVGCCGFLRVCWFSSPCLVLLPSNYPASSFARSPSEIVVFS